MRMTPTVVCSGRRRLWPAALLSLLLALLVIGCSAPSESAADIRMVPWRGDDGRFGFVDPDSGASLVDARFQHARPGAHGFAPVATADDRWGLVDANGNMALPADYATIEFIDTPRAALVVTKTEYNAWWRVWEWRIWPEFNILSTSHNGPTLTTRVPRAVWRVYDPATGETRYESDRPDDKKGGADSRYWRDDWEPERHRPRDLRIDHWPDGAVVIDNTLYADSDTGHLSAVAHDIRDRLAGGDFLQRIDDKRHRRIDANGQATDAPVYTERYGVPFETEDGESITVPRSNVFEDEAGRFYLFPDLSHPLPTTLADYLFADGTRLAARHFAGTNVATFMPVPNSPWFALVSRVTRTGQTEPGKTLTFLFDGDGRWAPGWTPREGFYCMLADGRMLFRYSEPHGVLLPDLTFEPLPMGNVGRGALGPHRYAGTDRDGRQGIYDTENRRWVFRAEHITLDSVPVAPGRASYRVHAADGTPGRVGLIDIDNGEIVLPPTYAAIHDDGTVSLSRDDGEPIHFYIDLQSGREYRDGAAQRPADES